MEQNNQPPQQPQPEQKAQEANQAVQEKKFVKKEGVDDNVIFVGSKPIINYIRSISVQLSKQSSDVIVRSRGKFISKAVDVAEIARRKFLEKEGVKIKDIKIASEEFEKEGKKMNVSTMDIIIGK